MKKLRFMRYLTYFTIILTLLSALPGAAFAAKVSSDGTWKPESVYARGFQKLIR